LSLTDAPCDSVEDIGGAAIFLVSEAANFINGEVLHADGGQHVAGPVLNPIRFSGGRTGTFQTGGAT
jgi:hypothetical protein